jgi:FlaA1/EpsC-like NDP-sugar epimerase
MTRFFLTLHDAVQLLLRGAEEGKGGEIFVMKMPTCKIVDLAEVLMEALGKQDVKIVELGTRPGEKIHEILYSDYESQYTYIYDKDYLVILPTIEIPLLNQIYQSCLPVQEEIYSSRDSLMTKDEIKKMLVTGGFIS